VSALDLDVSGLNVAFNILGSLGWSTHLNFQNNCPGVGQVAGSIF